MRLTLAPCFSSSKLKQMFQLVNNVGQQTAQILRNDIAEGNNLFEFRNLSKKVSVDVIATCAYGLEVNSLKNPDNIFQKMTKIFDHLLSVRNILKIVGFLFLPKLMKRMKLCFLGTEFRELFCDQISETMAIRMKQKIFRPDLVNLLMNVKEKQANGSAKKLWTDDHLCAQNLAFFIGGYSTITVSMSFTAYEIACNSDVQQKLYEEIYTINNNLDGRELLYEDIVGANYMDQVIKESLRKWPSSPLTGRSCSEPFDLKYDEDKEIKFNTKLDFLVPIISFHRDPKYFPEPDKFDPERFNEERKGNIDPDTYLPFGSGPRQCLGLKFAIMELKTIFYHLLLNFTIELSHNTDVPMKLDNSPFELKPRKGIWLYLNPRDNKTTSRHSQKA